MADERIVTVKIRSEYDGQGIRDLNAALKNAKKQSTKTNDSIIDKAKQSSQAIIAVSNAVNLVKAAWGGLSSIAGWFADTIAAANTNARAVNTLAAAYNAVGYTAEGAMKQAQAFASKMQGLTGIADEAFLNAQRLLANYGVVGTKAQEAIQSAYALSIGRSIDFAAAMDLVAKAAAGQTSALTRHGITLKDNVAEGEKFNAVLAQINERFGATAQAAMGDSTTKLNALKESWGDFREQIGAGLNDGLVPVVDFLTKAVDVLNKAFKSAGAIFGIVFDQIMIQVQETKSGFYTLAEGALNMLTPLVKVVSYLPGVGKDIGVAFDNAKNSLSAMSDNATKQADILREMRTPLSAIWETEKAITDEEEQQRALNEQKVNSKKRIVELSQKELDVIKKAREEEEKRVNRVLNNAGVGPKQTTSGWDTSSYEKPKPMDMASMLTGKDLDPMGDFLDKIEQQKEGLQDLYNKKLELLEQGHLDEQTFAEAKAELDSQYSSQTLQLDQEVAKKRQTVAANALNNLVSLQNSSNKKMAEVGKAAAIAQTTIATYQSATEAYKAMAGIPIVGPALAVAAAAAAIAAGMNNVAQISGVQLAEGGLVKAVTGGVPAVIGEGGSDEAVLPLDDSQAMRRIGGAIAEESGGGMGGVVVNINVQATGGVEAILEQLTDAARTGTVQALEFANINYKTGQEQQGYSV